MVTLFITLLILLQLPVKLSMNICDGIDGKHCCYGFKWDLAQNKCIPCDKGFHGKNCDTMCQYPSYGQDCQSVCKCVVQICDHVNGCLESTRKYDFQSTILMNYKTVTKEQIGIYNVSSDKGVSNVTADTTANLTTPVYKPKETRSQRINTVLFGIIGLIAVALIIYMLYLYTHVLERRLVNSITI